MKNIFSPFPPLLNLIIVHLTSALLFFFGIPSSSGAVISNTDHPQFDLVFLAPASSNPSGWYSHAIFAENPDLLLLAVYAPESDCFSYNFRLENGEIFGSNLWIPYGTSVMMSRSSRLPLRFPETTIEVYTRSDAVYLEKGLRFVGIHPTASAASLKKILAAHDHIVAAYRYDPGRKEFVKSRDADEYPEEEEEDLQPGAGLILQISEPILFDPIDPERRSFWTGRIRSPYTTKPLVLRGQLHCHTNRSDGKQTPAELASAYRDKNFDFIAITDHGQVTPDPKIDGIVCIPGSEIDLLSGHIAWIGAVPDVIRTRSIHEFETLRRHGGFVCLAHPNFAAYPWTLTETLTLPHYHAVEIRNGIVGGSNEQLWDAILSSGRHIHAVTVDDTHDFDPFRHPIYWTMVSADSDSHSDIVASLISGNYYSSSGARMTIRVQGRFIDLQTDEPSDIEWIVKPGIISRVDFKVRKTRYRIRGDEGYVRIRVAGRGIAWSNAVMVGP